MRINNRERGETRRVPAGYRLLSAVLCLLLMLPSLAVPSFADGTSLGASESRTGKTVSDTYLLSVSTGIVPGDSVLYFGIRYLDGSGTARTEYVFAGNSYGMDPTGKIVSGCKELYADAAKTVKNVFGYTVAGVTEVRETLRAYSTDQFLFTAFYGLSSIEGIDVYMSGSDGDKNQWTCCDMRLYRVETIYGVDMAGCYSADYFLDFDGTLLAQLATNGGIDFSGGANGEVIRIGRDTYDRYRLNTTFSEADRTYRSADSVRELIFRFDIADVYGGGIEALVNEYKDGKASIEKMHLIEALTVVMTYKDKYGGSHTVTLPVITSAVAWALGYSTRIAGTALNGVAGQGETLVFSGSFPEFDTLTGFTLVYGKESEKEAGLTYSGDASARRTERREALASDDFSYTGISIFDATAGRARASAEIEGAILACTTEGTPIASYRSSSTSGQTLNPGTRKNVAGQFSSLEAGGERSSTYLLSNTAGSYLFEIATDIIASAGTTGEITAVIRYHSTDGTEKSSDPMLLSDAIRSYYGYWPGKNGDAAYALGAAPGGKLVFTVGYSDVDYFTDVELSISGRDEWQMSSLVIYRIDGVSSRHIEWLSTDKTGNGTATDRNIYRKYTTDRVVQRFDKKVLLRPEENSVTIHFDGQSSSGGDIEWGGGVNWEEISREMTYNEAMQDLGFSKVFQRYTVNVQVQKNTSSSEIYGDCGSNNIFYFQLVFDNGKSAYVQANQQLSADGFRAGMTETFTIAVNRDYGEVRAVRIIPSDIDDRDIFDKLNIQDIEVVLTSSAGISKTWRVENVGWIDINYQSGGDAGASRLRAESEVSKNCLVTSKGYTMNFLVTVATGAYPSGQPAAAGSLTATVYYYKTSSNTISTAPIDVAAAIADYAGKSTVANEKQGVNMDLGGKYAAMLDPSYMLRENHVDRFIFSLSDVREIIGIKFHASGDTDTTWKIGGVDIYQIVSDGALYLNANDEYQRDAKLEHLCSDKGTDGYELPFIRTGTSEQMIEFQKNNININTDKWEAVIDRVPAGDDDTLNIYVYTTGGTDAAKAGSAVATVKYQMREEDKAYNVSARLDASGKNMLSVMGVGARGLSALYEMKIETENAAYIDRAVIQQVRSGVVIATYELPFGGENAQYAATASPRTNSGREEIERLTIQFADGTAATELRPETMDIAFSISYTTVNDLGDTVYESSYIYLTDAGITSIRAGMTAELTFRESYVKEIKKVNVLGIGPVNATITAAAVETASVEAGGIENRTGLYGVGREIPVTRTKQTFAAAAGSVVPLEMTFTTASISGADGAGITAELGVLDASGKNATVSLGSLSALLTAGGFRAGERATASVLLKNVTGIRYIRLTAASGCTWTLSSLTADWTVGGSDYSVSRTVGKTVSAADGCTVNFAEVSLLVHATVRDGAGNAILERNTTAGCELSMTSGNVLEVSAELVGALDGFGYTITGTKTGGTGSISAAKQGSTVVFTPVSEEGTSVFTITAAADEDASIKTVVTVTVNPAE